MMMMLLLIMMMTAMNNKCPFHKSKYFLKCLTEEVFLIGVLHALDEHVRQSIHLCLFVVSLG
jgi:hypothetical protein